MQSTFFEALDERVLEGWKVIQKGRYWRHLLEHGTNKDLVKRTLVEIYHYTRHNSINQAFASWRVPPEQTGLLRFCYQHAKEELGHEKMAVHDLESMGLLDADSLDAPPLPATEALIGYLYSVGLRYGAVARLGYSYWAESTYEHIAALVASVQEEMGISDRQMTFYHAHQNIDVKHAEEVREALERYATTPEDQAQVIQVAGTTLYLSGQILDNVLDTHLQLMAAAR